MMTSLSNLLKNMSLATNLTSTELFIKSNPPDADCIAKYAQLLCLAGDWSKALAQLSQWSSLCPQAKSPIADLTNLIKGENEREEVIKGRKCPEIFDQSCPWLAKLVSALSCSSDEAYVYRREALRQANISAGCGVLSDGKSFSFNWLMDGDTRFGPVCEVIINGLYHWIPFSSIKEIHFQKPVGVIDLIWRYARIVKNEGNDVFCHIPVRYPIEPNTSDDFLLGRITEWQRLDDEGEQFLGVGQKIWLNDLNEYPLLSIKTLKFIVGDIDEGHSL